MNPMNLLQLKPLLESFKDHHPKFLNFVSAVAGVGLKEDTILEMTVTTPEGKEYNSNLKLTGDDVELLKQLRQMM